MSDDVKPRERCPKCSSLLVTESEEPLEEFCIEPACEYYRAEVAGGGVVRE